MYFTKVERNGQLGGFLELEDLQVGKEYIVLDSTYKDKGFLKTLEYRIRNHFIFLVSDQWGDRPRTFEPVSTVNVFTEENEEIVGSIILTPKQHFVLMKRQTHGKPYTSVIIMELKWVDEEYIRVVVRERLQYTKSEKWLSDNYFYKIIRLGHELLDVEEIDPNLRSLYKQFAENGKMAN